VLILGAELAVEMWIGATEAKSSPQ